MVLSIPGGVERYKTKNEKLLVTSGVPYTICGEAMKVDNLFEPKDDPEATGVTVFMPAAWRSNTVISYITSRDLGDAQARLILGREQHFGARYWLTGTADGIRAQAVVDTIQKVVGPEAVLETRISELQIGSPPGYGYDGPRNNFNFGEIAIPDSLSEPPSVLNTESAQSDGSADGSDTSNLIVGGSGMPSYVALNRSHVSSPALQFLEATGGPVLSLGTHGRSSNETDRQTFHVIAADGSINPVIAMDRSHMASPELERLEASQRAAEMLATQGAAESQGSPPALDIPQSLEEQGLLTNRQPAASGVRQHDDNTWVFTSERWDVEEVQDAEASRHDSLAVASTGNNSLATVPPPESVINQTHVPDGGEQYTFGEHSRWLTWPKLKQEKLEDPLKWLIHRPSESLESLLKRNYANLEEVEILWGEVAFDA